VFTIFFVVVVLFGCLFWNVIWVMFCFVPISLFFFISHCWDADSGPCCAFL